MEEGRPLIIRCLRLFCAIVASLATVAWARGEYKLDASDELRLVVADQSQVSRNFTVSDVGSIFIIIGRRVTISGMAIESAAQVIPESLSKYIVDPYVVVDVSKYRPNFGMGVVANPGLYDSISGITLMKAFASASGLRGWSDKPDSAITSIRAGESHFVPFKQKPDAQI